MRYGLFPILLLGFFTFVLMVSAIVFMVVAISHAQTIILSPNGAPTYVYPGTATAPAIVIPPSGAPTYVYPGNTPAAPLVGVPGVATPPVRR